MVGLRSRFRGALLGVVVGDAIGAGFEGGPPLPAEASEQVADGRIFEVPLLSYTDDTAMTLALARSLVDRSGFDADDVARAFDDAYRNEPWRGWGRTVPAVLELTESGADRLRAPYLVFDGQGSEGDGAAMRVAPVGLLAYEDLGEVVELARASAEVTHTHLRGVDGAVVQAVAVALALRTPPEELDPSAFVAQLSDHAATAELRGGLQTVAELLEVRAVAVVAERVGNGFRAVEAVPAAVHAFLTHSRSLREAVRFAIRLGGDTDTAAITGAHLGEDTIPQRWLQRTEGSDEMRQMADLLLETATTRAG